MRNEKIMTKKQRRKRKRPTTRSSPLDGDEAEPLSPPLTDPYKKRKYKKGRDPYAPCHRASPRKSSTPRSVRARSPPPARAAFLLLPRQKLNQRGKRRRRQGHAPLQSVEQAGKAALGNDLAGALQIGPDGWPVKLGRPKIDSATERKVRQQLAKGVGILKVARSLGIGTGTVQRISKERAMSPRGAQQ